MFGIQSASEVWPGSPMSPTMTPAEEGCQSCCPHRVCQQSASVLALRSRKEESWASQNKIRTSEAHLNCSLHNTMAVTFYNLWEEGDEILGPRLDARSKARRGDGNNILITFFINLHGTHQHYRSMMSLILLTAMLVPWRRRNWSDPVSKGLVHSVQCECTRDPMEVKPALLIEWGALLPFLLVCDPWPRLDRKSKNPQGKKLLLAVWYSNGIQIMTSMIWSPNNLLKRKVSESLLGVLVDFWGKSNRGV